jgi:hypothetical protein
MAGYKFKNLRSQQAAGRRQAGRKSTNEIGFDGGSCAKYTIKVPAGN